MRSGEGFQTQLKSLQGMQDPSTTGRLGAGREGLWGQGTGSKNRLTLEFYSALLLSNTC